MCADIKPLPDSWDPSLSGDPIDLALLWSRRRREFDRDWLPDPACLEIGRRLLLAELQFSSWVLRRVEKVQFERERSVSRQISIDFAIRRDAPVFTSDKRREYLVPLSIMRRRTLVNLALTDEEGRRIPMLGLRVTQQLDESLLLAAAVAYRPELGSCFALKRFVQWAVAGTAEQVEKASEAFSKDEERAADAREGGGAAPGGSGGDRRGVVDPMPPPADTVVFLGMPTNSASPDGRDKVTLPGGLAKDPLFSAVFHRLNHNFTLYVLLDADGPRHRVLNLSFDEPTNWRVQRPKVQTETAVDGTRRWRYAPMQKVEFWPRLYAATAHLGWTATWLRFQTPSAEHAASYHFEASAPLGVRIVEASLLAGRPNDRNHPVSVDQIVGHTPTVGLHAVEVPNVSLCRVQLKLRVPSRGWLATLVVACLTIMLVLLSVTLQWRGAPPAWSENQVTNVVLLLVTASASAATLIAQREFGGLAATLVSTLRAVGAFAIALPIVAAVSLVYAGADPWRGQAVFLATLLWILTALSTAVFLVTGIAAWASLRAERRSAAAASPWDMTLSPDSPGLPQERTKARSDTYDHAEQDLGFDHAAIGINSAEGWHAVYGWTDALQERAVQALEPALAGADGQCGPGGGCATWASCPAHTGSDQIRRSSASRVPDRIRPSEPD